MLHFLSKKVAIAALLTSPHLADAQDDPFALLFGADPAKIDASEDDRSGEDDLRFVDVKLGALKLQDALTAYDRPKGLCVLTKDLLNALEVPFQDHNESLSGWFIDETRTFNISYKNKTIQHGTGAALTYEDGIFETPEGPCLLSQFWSDFLPINLTFDSASLTLRVDPLETLPLQARLEREAARALLEDRPVMIRPDFRHVDNPYRWLSWPVADMSIDINAVGSTGINVEKGIELAGDFLWTTGHIRTVKDDVGARRLRVSLDRKFYNAKGVLPKQLQFGDIAASSQPMMTRLGSGRGVRVTNTPAYIADIFDQTDIRGSLPTGWEAELHREGRLEAFTSEATELGEYNFTDVVLRPGYNHFEVKLYGPNGEVNTREVKIFAGQDMRPENEVAYDIRLIESGKYIDGPADEDTERAALVTLTYGVNRHVSTRLDMRVSDTGQAASTVSAFGAVGDTKGVIRLTQSNDYGTGFEAAFSHAFKNSTYLNGKYTEFVGPNVDDFGAQGATRRSARLNYDAKLPIGRWGVPVKTLLNWEQGFDGSERRQISTRLASGYKGWKLTKTNLFEQTIGAHSTQASGAVTGFSGTVSASKRLSSFRLRAGVNYRISPDWEVSGLNMALQKRLKKDGFMQISATRDMQAGQSQMTLGYSRDIGSFAVSGSAGMSGSGDWNVGVKLSTAMFFNPNKKRYTRSLPGLTRTGAVLFSVYDDVDGDAVPSGEDQPMAAAEFHIDQNVRQEQTNDKGELVMRGIQPHQSVNLQVATGSLADPFLQPVEAGRSIRLRQGQVVSVNMPLRAAGDVEGTVLLDKGSIKTPIAGVEVQVLNDAGEVIGSSITEYDGYVYIDGLPMGALSMRIAPTTLEVVAAESAPVSFALSREKLSSYGNVLMFKEITANEESTS